MKKSASELRAGDRIPAPAHERKWMGEYGVLKVTGVREGRPDKRGAWLWVDTTFVSPYVDAGGVHRTSTMACHMRPASRVTLLGRDEQFTEDQLQVLRAKFGAIERVDPDSPRFQQLQQMLVGMSDEMLQQVLNANIKWLSRLAVTRITERRALKHAVKQLASPEAQA